VRTSHPTRGTGVAGLVVIAIVTGACATDAPGTSSPGDQEDTRMLVAHRGASAYAPEHTMAAYRLAFEQGADYLEPDLQVTRDGVLICLHDLTLERTTNVREVFPERHREEVVHEQVIQRWYASDFTLEEIRQLDAGSWFAPSFAGAQIPTLAELIEFALGRAGIFPETKAPEVYGDLGLDMERLLVEELARHNLLVPGAHPATPVIIQSFSPESLQVLRYEHGVQLPLTLLVAGGTAAEEWLSPHGIDRARVFADGIGPGKGLLLTDPGIVTRAHAAGMTVVPYTFRSSDSGSFPDVIAEMNYFLYELGVDGLFTDNPDLFPRTPIGDEG